MINIENEAKKAIEAKTWHLQIQFIQHVEEFLMNDNNTFTPNEIQVCFNVFGKYIVDENKNIVQRSLKIIDALCQRYKDTKQKLRKFDIFSIDFTQIFKNVFRCLNDYRQNIREQSARTIQSLINMAGFTIFCQNTFEQASSFYVDGQICVTQFLKQYQYDMNDEEWKLVFNFLILIYEDKVVINKSMARDLFKNEMFLNQLRLNINKYKSNQQKIFQSLLDKQPLITANKDENCSLDNQNQYNSLQKNKDNFKTNIEDEIEINSSAFLHQQRQKELKDTDGLFLLTDISTFGSFSHRLSLDIRDVFDDKISELLLSQLSIIRVSAVNHLREIFNRSMKNFEYSVDIIIRWCIIQFLSWQLSISQASLSLLTDMMDFYKSDKKFKLTSKEVHIITPVVLWYMTTESEAFKYLLQQIKNQSNEKDYYDSLLMALSLDHIPVMAHIFDEMNDCHSFGTIRGRIEELSQESTTSFVREECKKLLMKHNPLSPRKSLVIKDPIKRLKSYITNIKKSPEDIEDCREIFGYILDMFDQKLIDKREIRYLIYCAHAFMTEPILFCQININDFSTLISLLCEFSFQCPEEFFDALISIGHAIVSIQANISIFDSLINYITQNYLTQNQQSFSYQIFRIGIQMIGINQNTNDLQHLKSFAKSVIGRFQLKNDIRARLCRELLAEILIIENGSFHLFDTSNIETYNEQCTQKSSESVSASNFEIDDNNFDGLSEFLRILKRLMKLETRLDSIQELIAFDERYPDKKIVETVIKLSPLLGKHIEEIKNRNKGKLKPSSKSISRNCENMSKNAYNSLKKRSHRSKLSQMSPFDQNH